jgi:LPXTG-motif cell wall-anchored protein
VSSLTLTLPGTKNGSTLPKGSAFFPGGSSFTTPGIALKVTAPTKPGTISTSLDSLDLLTSITLGTTKLGVALECSVAANTLGSVTVFQPGGPIVNPDSASTVAGHAVTIDVLKNDLPNDGGVPPDPSTLSVSSPPHHGTATVTADHRILYTNTSNAPTDSFTYQVCVRATPATSTTTTTEPHVDAVDSTLICGAAVVTVQIESAPTVQPQTAATTTTTVAPTQLPRTGSTTTPLVWVAVGLCAIGLAAIGLTQRRRTT